MESDWHRKQINLLIESLGWYWRGRSNWYAGGNMFIYFSREEARNRDFRGPDFFAVQGVDGTRMRDWWAIWDEGGRYPDTIIELLSPTTRRLDLGVKKDVYEEIFRTPEYVCYDPDGEMLLGWRLSPEVPSRYATLIPDASGRIELRTLGLWLGTWRGPYQGFEKTWLRFFDAQGRLVPTAEEVREDEKRRAEEEKHRADVEKQRADVERQRADALVAEVARLKAQLEQQQK
ncbi:MAG: Uma2 family endonuclease [Gemmataceae bacterium]